MNTKLKVQHGKRYVWAPVTLDYSDRIWFVESPRLLKDEIKSMRGSHWHGYDERNPREVWSIDDCQRNRFRLDYLQGKDAYAWFDRPVVKHCYSRPLMAHQCDLADTGLTYHYQIWAAEMGVGKTLAAQEVIERTGGSWWWIGPKTSIPNIQREFKKWHFFLDNGAVEFLTYDGLVSQVEKGNTPIGVIFDESSRLKTYTSKRSKAAQQLADAIRAKHGMQGFVILMSGTPSPKSPLDWWSQCEIAWPGFLREGSPQALEKRLAFLVKGESEVGIFSRRIGWRDNENKCEVCGYTRLEGSHDLESDYEEYHRFVPSVNEVALLHERLKGLVVIKHKADCLTLPEKQYRTITCKPTPSLLRAANALTSTAPNTITAATWLRELSDGFQYREQVDGTTKCDHCISGKVEEFYDDDRTYTQADFVEGVELKKREIDCPKCSGSGEMPRKVRITKSVACPKDEALRELLEECEETGRVVIFAGFTGSVDRIQELCHSRNWAVVRCDGRGFHITDGQGDVQQGDPLDYWGNLSNVRVAFVAHPESGGMSLTLTESRMAVFWSNSFKPEYRVQAEDRIHRKGMDENKGCVIVDLIHLPSDERVLEVIRDNRRLELMTLGEFANDYATAA